MQLLERAGVVLLTNRRFVAAIGVLAQIASQEPSSPGPWYGLGNALLGLARAEDRDAVECLRRSVACLRRALELDPGFTLARELIGVIGQRSALPAAEVAACEPFAGEASELARWAGFEVEAAVADVASLAAWKDRMAIVMLVDGAPSFAPWIVAALDDPHTDVCMAALKRAFRIAGAPGLRAAIERCVTSGRWREVEPYATTAVRSMARTEPWAAALLAQMGTRADPG
jgi:hypothetical protein